LRLRNALDEITEAMALAPGQTGNSYGASAAAGDSVGGGGGEGVVATSTAGSSDSSGDSSDGGGGGGGGEGAGRGEVLFQRVIVNDDIDAATNAFFRFVR
jgi:hypothetical protein